MPPPAVNMLDVLVQSRLLALVRVAVGRTNAVTVAFAVAVQPVDAVAVTV
jgi:hypothetical protein